MVSLVANHTVQYYYEQTVTQCRKLRYYKLNAEIKELGSAAIARLGSKHIDSLRGHSHGLFPCSVCRCPFSLALI